MIASNAVDTLDGTQIDLSDARPADFSELVSFLRGEGSKRKFAELVAEFTVAIVEVETTTKPKKSGPYCRVSVKYYRPEEAPIPEKLTYDYGDYPGNFFKQWSETPDERLEKKRKQGESKWWYALPAEHTLVTYVEKR